MVFLLSQNVQEQFKYTYTHNNTSWFDQCVTKTGVCGTGDKYTNIHNLYSVIYYKHFAKHYYRSSVHIKNFIYTVNGV
jgi:hypothetical protein